MDIGAREQLHARFLWRVSPDKDTCSFSGRARDIHNVTRDPSSLN